MSIKLGKSNTLDRLSLSEYETGPFNCEDGLPASVINLSTTTVRVNEVVRGIAVYKILTLIYRKHAFRATGLCSWPVLHAG